MRCKIHLPFDWRCRRMLREEYSSKQGEIQSLKKTQDDLNANRDKISNYIRIMMEETAALDANITVRGYSTTHGGLDTNKMGFGLIT